jgi:hypothetical protein
MAVLKGYELLLERTDASWATNGFEFWLRKSSAVDE